MTAEEKWKEAIELFKKRTELQRQARDITQAIADIEAKILTLDKTRRKIFDTDSVTVPAKRVYSNLNANPSE